MSDRNPTFVEDTAPLITLDNAKEWEEASDRNAYVVELLALLGLAYDPARANSARKIRSVEKRFEILLSKSARLAAYERRKAHYQKEQRGRT